MDWPKRYENDKCGRKPFWKRSKTAPFSFENGLVWTGPHTPGWRKALRAGVTRCIVPGYSSNPDFLIRRLVYWPWGLPLTPANTNKKISRPSNESFQVRERWNTWVTDRPSLFGQDGWILAKFFFCLFMDLDSVSVHKFAKKKRTRPISSLLDRDRTSLVNKGFIIWLSGKFFLRNTADSPERAR